MAEGRQFRAATIEDAEALAGFWRDRYGETFGHLYPAEDLQAFYADAYPVSRIGAEIADPHYRHVLAFSRGRLIGALKGGKVGLPVADAAGLWELHRLYLTPDAKGTGLGDAFMAIAQDHARAAGARAIVLGVFSENERAKRFYARHGFEKVGSYHFVVGATLDDEWILQAPLPPASSG